MALNHVHVHVCIKHVFKDAFICIAIKCVRVLCEWIMGSLRSHGWWWWWSVSHHCYCLTDDRLNSCHSTHTLVCVCVCVCTMTSLCVFLKDISFSYQLPLLLPLSLHPVPFSLFSLSKCKLVFIFNSISLNYLTVH